MSNEPRKSVADILAEENHADDPEEAIDTIEFDVALAKAQLRDDSAGYVSDRGCARGVAALRSIRENIDVVEQELLSRIDDSKLPEDDTQLTAE